MRRFILVTAMLSLFGACASITVDPHKDEDPRILSFHDVHLTRGDLVQELQFFNIDPSTPHSLDAEKLERVIGAMVVRKRLASVAEHEMGLLEHTEVRLRLRRERERVLFAAAQDQFRKGVVVPDLTDRAQAYYDNNPAQFQQPATRRIGQIFMQASDPSALKRQRQRMETLRQQLMKTPDQFGLIALKHSEDVSRYSEGDVGFEAIGSRGAEEEMAIQALRTPNEISPVVTAPNGVYLFILKERRGESIIPFDQVKERLVDTLANEYINLQIQQWMDSVLSGWDETFTPDFYQKLRDSLSALGSVNGTTLDHGSTNTSRAD